MDDETVASTGARQGESYKMFPAKPEWLRKRLPVGAAVQAMEGNLEQNRLHTICQEACCPNQGECFAKGVATFLIMGNVCTRNCRFCAVDSGTPLELDANEPLRLAEEVKRLGLRFVVVTSVTRDDLPDGGAEHFARVIEVMRSECPGVGIEVLIPDLQGSRPALKTVVDAAPEVLNHNIETVPRLYRVGPTPGRLPALPGSAPGGEGPEPVAHHQIRADGRARGDARRDPQGHGGPPLGLVRRDHDRAVSQPLGRAPPRRGIRASRSLREIPPRRPAVRLSGRRFVTLREKLLHGGEVLSENLRWDRVQKREKQKKASREMGGLLRWSGEAMGFRHLTISMAWMIFMICGVPVAGNISTASARSLAR